MILIQLKRVSLLVRRPYLISHFATCSPPCQHTPLVPPPPPGEPSPPAVHGQRGMGKAYRLGLVKQDDGGMPIVEYIVKYKTVSAAYPSVSAAVYVPLLSARRRASRLCHSSCFLTTTFPMFQVIDQSRLKLVFGVFLVFKECVRQRRLLNEIGGRYAQSGVGESQRLF